MPQRAITALVLKIAHDQLHVQIYVMNVSREEAGQRVIM